jgi:hypothetical protein
MIDASSVSAGRRGVSREGGDTRPIAIQNPTAMSAARKKAKRSFGGRGIPRRRVRLAIDQGDAGTGPGADGVFRKYARALSE